MCRALGSAMAPTVSGFPAWRESQSERRGGMGESVVTTSLLSKAFAGKFATLSIHKKYQAISSFLLAVPRLDFLASLKPRGVTLKP